MQEWTRSRCCATRTAGALDLHVASVVGVANDYAARVADLGPVAWPPHPIGTERLLLREPEADDRAALIELFASSEVNTFLGGPRARDDLERAVPEAPERRSGFFVVALDGTMIGVVSFDRRDVSRPGQARDGVEPAGVAELSYLFLPKAWGHGYAAEACGAALDWFDSALPGEPVVLCTQTANDRSMRLAVKLGFTEVQRFEEFDARQWFGVRRPDDRPERA
ncbi:GNAT family N-acetyltransferase [soil metagenome]